MLKELSTKRVEKGLTQEALAELMGDGTTQEMVSLYERGLREPLAGRVMRMAEVLGCTVEDLR